VIRHVLCCWRLQVGFCGGVGFIAVFGLMELITCTLEDLIKEVREAAGGACDVVSAMHAGRVVISIACTRLSCSSESFTLWIRQNAFGATIC
jgi:hypothetical protein